MFDKKRFELQWVQEKKFLLALIGTAACCEIHPRPILHSPLMKYYGYNLLDRSI